jgi:mannose-6-phosphate isomerase-like protein (cupin superfamily)
MSELAPVRRVITGHDDRGVAQAIIDDQAPNARTNPRGVTSTLIWSTDQTPASIALGLDVEDAGAKRMRTQPPPCGSRFTVNDYPPGGGGAMHRTETIDYVIVLAGEIDMVLDDGAVTLRAGDVLVQRGTNHQWINRGTVTARIAFILVDAEPLGIGHPRDGGKFVAGNADEAAR